MSEPIAAVWRCVVVSAIALNLLACGEANTSLPGPTGGGGGVAGSSPSGAGGTAGAGGAEVPLGVAIVWGADGFVAPDTNPFAIGGPFYAYSDCDPQTGLACTMPDAALTGPDSKPGWSVDASRVCLKGTAVQVKDMMFSAQWGAGLALDLNSKGGDPGTPAVKGTFDLRAGKIKGFSVDISGAAPTRIRINITMPGVPDSSFVDAKVPGTTTFNVADAKPGTWVTSKTPLDATKVEALQFQVFTTAAAATPYDFCVNAIRVIADEGP